MKLLSFNVNYFLGFDGRIRDYLRHPFRSIRAGQEAEATAMNRFVSLVTDEQPDVIALLEVDQGSFRTHTTGHCGVIVERCRDHGLAYDHCTDNKYGRSSILSRLPILHGMSNSLLWTGDATVTHHEMPSGTKRLVHELQLPSGLSVFSVHLPVIRHRRKQHLQALAGIIRERDRVVVCGDFNNYYGVAELDPLTAHGLRIHRPGDTLPNAPLPYREVDLVLASSSVEVERCDVLDTAISDHLPVVLEIEL